MIKSTGCTEERLEGRDGSEVTGAFEFDERNVVMIGAGMKDRATKQSKMIANNVHIVSVRSNLMGM